MRRCDFVALLCLAAGCGHRTTGESNVDRTYLAPYTLVNLKDPRLTESSGIVESPTTPGVFYTHNDSGDKARIFRFDAAGNVKAILIRDAKNVDWEDIAAARLDGQPYLFIGDIGDNEGQRKSITVYRVPEPSHDRGDAAPDRIYTLVYPDEPHNAETLMVHPITGDFYVVTKASTRNTLVFKVDRPSRSGDYQLKKIGEISLGGIFRHSRLVSGGAISPDGRHVVLRTYTAAYEFDAGPDFDKWVEASPRTIRTNVDGQGEGISYLWSGKGLITSSEGTPAQISQIPLKP